MFIVLQKTIYRKIAVKVTTGLRILEIVTNASGRVSLEQPAKP
jgi:hypothetical protein